MKQFPKIIYVSQEEEDEGDDEYFLDAAYRPEGLAVIGESKVVGIYALKETVTLGADVQITGKDSKAVLGGKPWTRKGR